MIELKKEGRRETVKLLVLAEKKSLAEKIAKGLTLAGGKAIPKRGHIEVRGAALNGRKVDADIYYLAGHVLEPDIEKSFGKGENSFPDRLILKPKKRDIYSLVKKALERAKKGEYDFVVEAGDPDREGELLVRELLEEAGVPMSKVKRAWWNSETPKALKEAFENLKPASHFDSLYKAGKLRQLGDAWVGINLSRTLQRLAGNRNLSVGRVQTPVLALIVKRDLEIENFKPEKFFELVAFCRKDGKSFSLRFKERIKDEKRARAVREVSLENRPFVVVKVEKKRKKQRPPQLPKLADVQNYAGRLLKTTAENVLKVVQGLYERGILSYPRTESNYLADADEVLVVKALKFLGREDLIERLENPEIRKFIFNTKDVEKKGHHAIVPLAPLPENATKEEKVVYDFVVKRLLANLYGYYYYEETKVVATPDGKKDLEYIGVGRTPLSLGWKEIYSSVEQVEKGEDKESEETLPFPPLSAGEKVEVEKILIREGWTKPPSRYTSASLIAAMEKLGIGTPATRHLYEKILIKRGYLSRNRKGQLISTEAGRKLIESLSGTQVADVSLTSQWEQFLKKLEFKEIDADRGEADFKRGIKSLVLKTASGMQGKDYSYLKRRPTTKMVKFALSLVSRVGENVDEHRLQEDWSYCQEVIERLKGSVGRNEKRVQKPTEKQIAFARKLSKEKGVKIPEKVLQDRREMSRWIDGVLKK